MDNQVYIDDNDVQMVEAGEQVSLSFATSDVIASVDESDKVWVGYEDLEYFAIPFNPLRTDVIVVRPPSTGGGGGGDGVWGQITGTLSNQADLYAELQNRGKLDSVNYWQALQYLNQGFQLPNNILGQYGTGGAVIRGTAIGDLVMAAGTGTGNVYVRPAGQSSTTYQSIFGTDGYVTLPRLKVGAGAGAGGVMLELTGDRAWQFRQGGSGSTSYLELYDAIGGKRLEITTLSSTNKVMIDPNSSTVTATNFSGLASNATKLAAARTLNLGGELFGSVSFDGSANVDFGSRVRNYVTANTAGDKSNWYGRIARITLGALYHDSAVELQMMGTSDGATISRTSRIRFRAKQQVALPGLPYVNVEMERGSYLNPSDVVAIVGDTTAYPITVDLYVKISGTYSALRSYIIGRGGSQWTEMIENESLVQTLPAGTQVVGIPSIERSWADTYNATTDVLIAGNSAWHAGNLPKSILHTTDKSSGGDLRFASSNGRGVRFWDNDSYKIWMSAATDTSWGGRVAGETTSDYNMYFRMTGGINRGFVFESTYGTKLLSINPNGVRSVPSITAPSFIGALTGNADSATKLATARTINGVSFDGTADITVPSGPTSMDLYLRTLRVQPNTDGDQAWIRAEGTTGVTLDAVNGANNAYAPLSIRSTALSLNGLTYVNGNFHARSDAVYLGGRVANTGNKIRVFNPDSSTAVRIDAVTADFSAFAAMQFRATGYTFNTGRVSIFNGTFGTQTGLIGRGYDNGIIRWQDVMEADGSFALYAYDTAGSTPTRMLNIRSAVAGGSNDMTLSGKLAIGGASVGSDVYGTVTTQGGMKSLGGNAALIVQQRDNSSIEWHMYGTGNQWRVWNSANGVDIIKCGTGGEFRVNNQLYLDNGWFRSQQAGTGWYSEPHGGGIYMQDSNWVRVYGGKGFLVQSNLRIESTSPTIECYDTDGNYTNWIHCNDGNHGFLQHGVYAWGCYRNVSNDWICQNNIVAYASDDRLKMNKHPVPYSRVNDFYSRLEIEEFDWDPAALQRYKVNIKPNQKEIGSIAQKMQKIFPDAVRINESHNPIDKNAYKPDILTILWEKTIPLAHAEIQRLRQRVSELEAMAGRLAALENAVGQLMQTRH